MALPSLFLQNLFSPQKFVLSKILFFRNLFSPSKFVSLQLFVMLHLYLTSYLFCSPVGNALKHIFGDALDDLFF